MKTQTNYKNCKNIWNFDQNALFNRMLLHNGAPVRPKITSRNQQRYKIFCILSTITYGIRKTPTFHKQRGGVKTGNLYTYKDQSGFPF